MEIKKQIIVAVNFKEIEAAVVNYAMEGVKVEQASTDFELEWDKVGQVTAAKVTLTDCVEAFL